MSKNKNNKRKGLNLTKEKIEELKAQGKIIDLTQCPIVDGKILLDRNNPDHVRLMEDWD